MNAPGVLKTGLVALLIGLAGCAGTPPPDWQLEARTALDRAVAAQLSGNDTLAALDFARGRAALARTGRADLLARAELLHCAATLAGLTFEPCTGFAALRQDAAPAEAAYADYLQAPLNDPARMALLPPAQQAVATPSRGSQADLALLQAITDPLSRLVAAAVWFRDGRASPAVMALAAETASAQGWRRPLLAWLALQRQRAQAAGEIDEAARLNRRMNLVTGA